MRQVLRIQTKKLRERRAVKEMADKLSLTVGTVCWYLHGIYRKLHVQSRVQAINKMQESPLHQ
jgi:DNA-binding NarL/FixJ family response regulator